MKAHKWHIPTALLTERIQVILVGAGGTGGEMLDRLIRVHHGLVKTGHPGGLHVTLVDGDTISEANIGRQRFAPFDVGQAKASTLIHRANVAFGLDWEAKDEYASPKEWWHCDLLVTCVDRAGFRAEVGVGGRYRNDDTLWLDTGNGATTGQVVLGHLGTPDSGSRLPNVYDLYPELEGVNDDAEPSCSFAEAIRHQDLTINPMIADAAANILWRMLRHGGLDFHGATVDLTRGSVAPLPIDPRTWEFFGYRGEPAKAGAA